MLAIIVFSLLVLLFAVLGPIVKRMTLAAHWQLLKTVAYIAVCVALASIILLSIVAIF